MKTKFCIIAIITFVISLFSGSAHALTEQWTYDLGTETADLRFDIDQIAVDGKGGCAIVWIKENHDTWVYTVYVTYFDKKGNKVWEKSYPDKIAEIAYCTKKMVIFSLAPEYGYSGNQVIVTIDNKGKETVIEKPEANIDVGVNSEMEPLGDKKGFFVERHETGMGKCSLVRYTYK